MTYDLTPLQAPRAAGALLRTFVALVENGATASLLGGKLLRDAGIEALRSVPAGEPVATCHPVLGRTPRRTGRATGKGAHGKAASPIPAVPTGAALGEWAERLPSAPSDGFRPEGTLDFHHAYREGRSTPRHVAERALDHVSASEQLDPPMRLFIAQDKDDLLRQADESTRRWRAGKPLGPLDGVPVAVKDELDQAGYPTTVGTRFLGLEPAREDAEVVARLRAAGALLLGKANMHEIGLGVTGLNPHHGAARNPYDPSRATGGSSSGPAAAVAAGLCPIAVGADGGGSIRIPAALCGVVGLKPTFGRVSEHGAAPLCWSLAHVGPIAATVRDAALGYALMAGPDEKDPPSLLQPTAELRGVDRTDLTGLKVGLYPAWFESADAEVVERCRAVLRAVEHAGAEIVEVEVPELGVLRTVHLVTIISEMAAAHFEHYRHHRREYALDTRLNLALARRLQAFDYLHAQRLRVRISQHFAELFARVDLIVTPATCCTAPRLAADALETGESNLALTDRIMRFAPAANLTGLPALSVPAGYDAAGLPVGIQLLGRAWQEHLLLRVGVVVEQHVVRQRPAVCYGYLER